MRRILPAFALLLLLTALVRLLPEPAAPALGGDARRLPVIMYHSLLKDPARSGPYILPPKTFEQDLIYLREQGYETVLPGELIAFCEGRGTLPERPVLITFDDGCLNNLTYALPLLEKYDAKAVISVVGAFTDAFSAEPDPNPNYAYLSWEELNKLVSSGRVELGNHTYNMHAAAGRPGCMKLSGESAGDYQSLLRADLGRLQAAFAEHALPCVTFAYPFGRISPEAAPVLGELGFQVTLTCFERLNVIEQGEPESLLDLGRFNRPAGDNSASFFRRVLNGR